MDFHQLLAKMQELDTPAIEQTANEMGCGTPPSIPPVSQEPPPAPHPSMSVNLNAQGMDNIESLMKLFQKVNPDMMPKDPTPMPSLSSPPSILSIKPTEPPLRMLPDFDSENNDMPGGEKDSANDAVMKMDLDNDDGEQPSGMISSLDRDGDGDHDMDDHDLEPEDGDDDEEDKKEAYSNEPAELEVQDKGYPFDAEGNDLNKPKGTYPKVAGADNPMQKMESTDLRSQIRAELHKRLAEAKRS